MQQTSELTATQLNAHVHAMEAQTAPSGQRGAKRAAPGRLLGAVDIRRIAAQANVNPTKKLGQNFVTDPGTVRRIVREAGVRPGDHVMEIGPGLGSLTLALLEAGANVTAVEIDPILAARLPLTIDTFMPAARERLNIANFDALNLTPQNLPDIDGENRFALVANLPYNVATPILLTLLERFANLGSVLVMVQKEVADRLVATPGSKVYGSPSVKLAWYGRAKRVGVIGRNVFWPTPNVDSALVAFTRYTRGERSEELAGIAQANGPNRTTQLRPMVFRLIDAAFGQRRKTLHTALKALIPEQSFEDAGIDPTRRGETLTVEEFIRLAAAAEEVKV